MIYENKTDNNNISDFINMLRERPIWGIPLLVIWVFYAVIVIYLIDQYQEGVQLTVSKTILILMLFSIGQIFASTALLQMMKLYNAKEKVSISGILERILSPGILVLFVLSFIWLIAGVSMIVVDFFIGNKVKVLEDRDFTLKVTAMNIYKGQSSIWDLPLSLQFRTIRMILFMILPVMIWEGTGFISGYRKSVIIIRKHIQDIILNQDFSSKAQFYILIIPLGVLVLNLKRGFHLPDWCVWIDLCYVIYAVSFILYLDQISVVDRYLKYMEQDACQE